ncbi:MAG: flagellar basal-body rod protein FlgG [Myxococcota bacterium]|nr:flagellar basal-body rod protein FlgG [Myxococcota bacterium]
MRSLYTAATGMKAQQLRIDNISNNLANVNTTAFKKSRADFEDLYYQKIRTGGTETAGGTRRNDSVEIGHGSRAANLTRDFRMGGVVQTGRPTDIAVDGTGFFQLQTAEGDLLYTRAGNFGLDDQGNLITPQGHQLAGGIQVPEGSVVSIQQDGLVFAQIPGDTDLAQIGQIELARFANAAGLEGLGAGLFRETEASGAVTTGNPGVDGFGKTLGQALETSNVDVADELISMILAQRSYELTSKAISTADEMLQVTNQLK